MAGWRTEPSGKGGQAALIGRADSARFGPWHAIGLAMLNTAADLCAPAGSDAVQPPPADVSDIALIARLRDQDGPGFADRLSGGFSVVLINRQTGRIEAYRDHFGIMPFYYCVHGGFLTCASDIRAGLHLSDMPLADMPVRIADFLMAEEVDPALTAFSGLARLPAAHRLTWGAGGACPEPYWVLHQPPRTDPDTAPDRLRVLLRQATEGLTRAAPALGAMLSGGLDSSSLAGLAARIRQDRGEAPLTTLSFVYGDGAPQDESPYIDAANAAFHTTPHKIPVTEAPQLADIAAHIEEQMDLFLGFGMQKSRRIYAEAAGQGLTALIDGHGGDEVISHGYGRLVELAASRRWGRLFTEMRGVSRIHDSPLWAPYLLYIARHGGLNERHILRRVLLRGARILLGPAPRTPTGTSATEIMTPVLRDSIAPETRYKPPPDPGTRDERQNAEQIDHMQTLQAPLIQHAFEVLHRSAVSQGILPLYPFYDRAVVLFCLSVPSEAKLRGGQTRWVLREAMRGVLPETIRTRATKAAFNDEFRTSVMTYLEATGPAAFAGLGRYVDDDAAERLRRQLLQSDENDVDGLRLGWRLAVLRYWARAFDRWCALQARGELI